MGDGAGERAAGGPGDGLGLPQRDPRLLCHRERSAEPGEGKGVSAGDGASSRPRAADGRLPGRTAERRHQLASAGRGGLARCPGLATAGRGGLVVRYVPPSPEHMLPVIDGLMRMANAEDDVPPLIKAALVSFGFVFVHPFMDGNGRLSRLLAHHCLHMKGALPDVKGSPAILPLSVAMKQEERRYLAALESFSKPARALWDVQFIGDGDFVFDFRSTPMVYAHWSGAHAAAFVTRCARVALQQSLVDEAQYLQAYDLAYERIDKQFDL